MKTTLLPILIIASLSFINAGCNSDASFYSVDDPNSGAAGSDACMTLHIKNDGETAEHHLTTVNLKRQSKFMDPARTVCHKPPGNPSNSHTIIVGGKAVSAHLKHGDSLGECDPPKPKNKDHDDDDSDSKSDDGSSHEPGECNHKPKWPWYDDDDPKDDDPKDDDDPKNDDNGQNGDDDDTDPCEDLPPIGV